MPQEPCSITSANLKWDTELQLMDIPESMLPEVKSSSEAYGESMYGIPISGIAGDRKQAAMFGQMCLQPGMLKTPMVPVHLLCSIPVKRPSHRIIILYNHWVRAKWNHNVCT